MDEICKNSGWLAETPANTTTTDSWEYLL